MTISSKIRAMLGRTIRAVPAGYLAAEPPEPEYTYLPASDLPPMLVADAQPWRVDPTTGEQWYRIGTVVDDPEDMEGTDDEN